MTTKRRPGASKVLAVARREFVVRATTRTFAISTILLVVAAAVVSLAPVVVGYFNEETSRVAVHSGAANLQADPVTTLDALLNPPHGDGSASSGAKAFEVRPSTDLEADRARVLEGTLAALVVVERDAAGDTAFTVYTNEPGRNRQAQIIIRQAATSIAVADRLARAGVVPSDQARLFEPPVLVVRSPDPAKPLVTPEAAAQETTDILVTVGLEVFLLLAIILYGTWVAQSVVEEKSSRMMEIILVSASPFELLAGKVLGVSAAALLQYGAVLAAVAVALLGEGHVASIVLGEPSGPGLPAGLTPSLLAAFSVLFVLGFLLYAVLFAAAGSLVSRQEDVSQVITPMTMLCSAGYMVAVFTAMGSFDPDAGWILAFSWIPFVSPYAMVSRLAAGTAGPLEFGVAVVLLVAAILLATFVAARVYTAGVLMYGQKPSVRRLLTAVRQGS